jgi:hypothetical protein
LANKSTFFEEPYLETRSTTTPGSFLVLASSILNFPTENDFHQTASYIFSDTSNSQLNAYRSSLPIKTIASRSQEISDSLETGTLSFTHILSNPSIYSNIVDIKSNPGDTTFNVKHGAWAEFLNPNGLMQIEGYLYKFKDSTTIIILDGDLSKIPIAETLEDSDTINQIIIRHAWTPKCNCNVTNRSWSEEQEKVHENEYRTRNTLSFANLTTVKYLPNYRVRVTPHWVIKTFIHVQKRGFAGIWNCERKNITFNRQVQIKHTFESIPSNSPNNQGGGYWNESTGWLTASECQFNYITDYKYDPYEVSRSTNPLDGYCFAIHTFAQTGNITNPELINTFFHWLYYEKFPDKWKFLFGCGGFWNKIKY